jgi:hypothetical protein
MAKKDLIKRADGSYSQRGLWDNIRANAGSGKKPTKEMLEQEKKINKMANGGMISSFKASNIQTYAQGGTKGNPFDKWISRTNPTSNIYVSPYYTNSFVGNSRVPGYRAGISTATGAGQYKDEPVGWYGGGYVGQQYNPRIPGNTSLDEQQQAYQNTVSNIKFPEALSGTPNGKNLMFGANIGWQGRVVRGGVGGDSIFPGAMPRFEAQVEYAPSTGLGGGIKAGSAIPLSRGNYRNGEVKAGINNASFIIEPYTGGTVNSTKGSGWGWGIHADAEYRPRLFNKLNIPGYTYFSGNLASPFGEPYKDNNNIDPATGQPYSQDKTAGVSWRPNISAELGYRIPLQRVADKLPPINMPNINMPDINLPEINMPNINLKPAGIPVEGDPMGDFGPINASPIEKQFDKKLPDMYLNPQVPTPRGASIPLEEMQEENNFRSGGAMRRNKNSRAFAEGGPFQKGVEQGSIYGKGYYTDPLTGSVMPSANIGFQTALMGKKKNSGWTVGAQVGMPYEKFDSTQVSPFSGDSVTAGFYTPKLYGKLPITAGLNASYLGTQNNFGNTGKARADLKADYNPHSGLGFSAVAGPQFHFGYPQLQRGELRSGKAYATVTPFGGYALNSKPFTEGATPNTSGITYGVKAEGEWKPKLFKNVPISVYGKGMFSASPGGGKNDSSIGEQQYFNTGTGEVDTYLADDSNAISARYGVSGEAGVRIPIQKVKQSLPAINWDKLMPNVNIPDINMPDIELADTPTYGDPNGDFGPVNASPIDKQFNKELPDMYLNPQVYSSGTESIPLEEIQQENNFKQGGAMNFKSPAAYKAWLAYGHASGEFERTPGNQAVSIGGKAHNVKHAMGGHMYSMGGRAFAQGGQLTEFTEGGSHEMNPLGGIPQGFAQDGKLNLVEQGETKLNAADYIFSDEIKVSKESATLYDLPKSSIGKTYADLSKKLNRPDSRRENDTIEQTAIQRDLENLMQAQEQQKESEKQAAIVDMQTKYPDLQVVDPAAMAQQQAMADEAAMQQQQQMAPPAGMPQEMDPAMMQQMQQQGMMRMGGKIYNMGGHMYGAGGGMMALRGIGSAAYGVGEGIVDTLTFGLTDNLTDKGYEKLSQLGDVDDRQAGRLDAVRGFGNTAGAVTGAVISGGATTDAAISEGVEGLASGVAALPGTNEQVDKVAQGVGQLGSMYGQFFGGSPGKVVPEGALKGSKAAAALMNAPQNKFITQAMNVAGNVMAQGGYLGAPTNGVVTNQFAGGSFLDTEPKAVFNINGTPVTMTLSEALEDPTIIEMFAPDGVQRDEDGDIIPEDQMDARQAAREAIMAHFNTAAVDERMAAMPTLEPNRVAPTNEGDDLSIPEGVDSNDPFARLAGETADEHARRLHKMITDLDQKSTLEEIKANPVLAAATALPALYNIGRGIFGKVDKLDAKDYLSKSKISPYEMNVDPQVAAAQRAYATSIQAAKNAAPGAGSYLATLGNMANMRQQAVRDIYAQKENFDKAQKLEADKFNAQVEQGNMAQELAIQQYNAQAQAAKQNMLATGLGQLATAAEGLSSQDLQEKYLQTISPDFAQNFNYVSILEQMARAKAKSKN